MKSIAIKDLSENFFEVIGKEWMLVTAGSKEHFNTMTASWGGIGWLWNKPVVFVFIRSERYTYEFMEENEYFTLSFLGKENRSIYNLCGSKSGREVDKVKETGLNPIVTERGNILFEQDRPKTKAVKAINIMNIAFQLFQLFFSVFRQGLKKTGITFFI